jgi:hypothetical protein
LARHYTFIIIFFQTSASRDSGCTNFPPPPEQTDAKENRGGDDEQEEEREKQNNRKKKEQGAGRKLEDRSFAQRLPSRAKSLQNQVSPSFSPLCKFSFICNCAKVI